MKKVIFCLFTLTLLIGLFLPIVALASEDTVMTPSNDDVTSYLNGGFEDPKGYPLMNYSWDEGGWLDKADIRNAIGNLFMMINVVLVGSILSFVELCLNPTPLLLNDSAFSFLSFMEWIFSFARIIQAIILAFMPFILSVLVAIDFTKGDYRKILNRFVQFTVGIILVFTYDKLINDPEKMRDVVDATQSGQYLLLAVTAGEMTDSNLSIDEATLQSYSTAFTTTFQDLKTEVFNVAIAYPWELGEYGTTNMTLGTTREDDFTDEVNRTSKVQDKTQESPPKVRKPDGSKENLTLNDNTKWRDVILYYSLSSETREDLIGVLDPDEFPSGFDGGNRMIISFVVSLSTLFIAIFWTLVSVGLLVAYVLVIIGIPIGSLAFVAVMVPIHQTIRLIKGWLGYMMGSLIAKYLTVLTVGIVVRIGKDFSNAMLSGTGTSMDDEGGFKLWMLFIYSGIYIITLVAMWLLRDKISPFRYFGFAMESAYAGMSNRPASSRYDPLNKLEHKLRRGQREVEGRFAGLESGTPLDLLPKGLRNKFGKNKIDPEKNGGNPSESNNSVPVQAESKNEDKNQPINPELVNDNMEDKLEPKKEENKELHDLKELGEKENPEKEGEKEKVVSESKDEEETKRKLVALSNGKLASFTYRNGKMADKIKNGAVKPQLNRNLLQAGSYQLDKLNPSDIDMLRKTNVLGINSKAKNTKTMGEAGMEVPKRFKMKPPSLLKPSADATRKNGTGLEEAPPLLKPKMDKNQEGTKSRTIPKLVKDGTIVQKDGQVEKENRVPTEGETSIPSLVREKKVPPLVAESVPAQTVVTEGKEIPTLNQTQHEKEATTSKVPTLEPTAPRQESEPTVTVKTTAPTLEPTVPIEETPRPDTSHNVDFLASGKWDVPKQTIPTETVTPVNESNEGVSFQQSAKVPPSPTEVIQPTATRMNVQEEPKVMQQPNIERTEPLPQEAKPTQNINRWQFQTGIPSSKPTEVATPVREERPSQTVDRAGEKPFQGVNRWQMETGIPSSASVKSQTRPRQSEPVNESTTPTELPQQERVTKVNIPSMGASIPTSIPTPSAPIPTPSVSIPTPNIPQGSFGGGWGTPSETPVTPVYEERTRAVDNHHEESTPPPSDRVDRYEPTISTTEPLSYQEMPIAETQGYTEVPKVDDMETVESIEYVETPQPTMDSPIQQEPVTESQPMANPLDEYVSQPSPLMPSQDAQEEIVVELPNVDLPLPDRHSSSQSTTRNDEQPLELFLDDPFDNSYWNDDRLTDQQKYEIESHQLALQDQVYANAVNFVQSKGKASQNLLRKELKMDTHVAKLMLQRMQDDKIIGAREGIKGHPVLDAQGKASRPEEINPSRLGMDS